MDGGDLRLLALRPRGTDVGRGRALAAGSGGARYARGTQCRSGRGGCSIPSSDETAMTPETLRLQARPFDDMAAAYGASCTTTAYGTCLRAFVWERLDGVFGGAERVLEIGCGTGEDAVHLANRGVHVLAT